MSFSTMLSIMSEGMLRTIEIFVLTLVLSLPLGLVVAACRKSKCFIIRFITSVFISIMRGTPLMLQLMVFYFGPYYLFKASIGEWRYPAIILGFSINYAAYFAEIYRSGIDAIPKGQYEAAKILGYNKYTTFMKIILPQVIRIVLPSITNEIITLVKDTSLAYTLNYLEMFALAKQIAAANTTMIPFVVAGVFYYIFNLVVSVGMEWIENKLRYDKD